MRSTARITLLIFAIPLLVVGLWAEFLTTFARQVRNMRQY